MCIRDSIYDHGVEFLNGKEKTPWFLYLGTVDTHVSWRAKEPWMSKYDPGYKGRFADTFGGADAGAAASGKMQLTPDEIKHVRALYDCNVSYQDMILDKLIQKLTEWGIWDQTMLVVTADHGDEQWEDGRVGHGGSERDMLIHVPLLVHYPPLVGTAAVAAIRGCRSTRCTRSRTRAGSGTGRCARRARGATGCSTSRPIRRR